MTTTVQPDTQIGMVGLGLMGIALAERLIAAGFAVAGHDIDATKNAALVQLGGRAVMLDELARQCANVVIAVYDGAQVEDVVALLERHPPEHGRTVICTTTCEPDCVDRLARHAATAGMDFIEAPLSGTSAEVRAGTATALVAGANETVARLAPVLIALSPHRVSVGRVGDASRMKLAINLVLQSNRAALAEGLVFAETIGLNPSAFLEAARASAAYSRVMDTKGDKMLRRDFYPQSHIAQTLKDAELILGHASAHALTLPMTTTQADLLRKAIALRGGDCDSSAVIEAIRPSPATERTPS